MVSHREAVMERAGPGRLSRHCLDGTGAPLAAHSSQDGLSLSGNVSNLVTPPIRLHGADSWPEEDTAPQRQQPSDRRTNPFTTVGLQSISYRYGPPRRVGVAKPSVASANAEQPQLRAKAAKITPGLVPSQASPFKAEQTGAPRPSQSTSKTGSTPQQQNGNATHMKPSTESSAGQSRAAKRTFGESSAAQESAGSSGQSIKEHVAKRVKKEASSPLVVQPQITDPHRVEGEGEILSILMPWQYEFSADAQSGQSTPGATPPISSTFHGRDAPPNGFPKADAEGSSGRSGAPQCPSVKADQGGVSDGPPIRSAVPSKNESSVMSGLSAQQQGPSIVVANADANYQDTASGSNSQPRSGGQAAAAQVEAPAPPPAAVDGVDPDVIRYVRTLGLSPDVYARKLVDVGIKNGAILDATRSFVPDSHKDKLEEALQTKGGLTVAESLVLIGGLRGPTAP